MKQNPFNVTHSHNNNTATCKYCMFKHVVTNDELYVVRDGQAFARHAT